MSTSTSGFRFTQRLRARLQSRLRALYGDAQAAAMLPRLEAIHARHQTRLQQLAFKRGWDQHDAILITYGGSIQAPGEKPLHTLRRFLHERLQNCINLVHILPFYPYSSDDGFSVIDYREVDEQLGSWEDVEAIAQEYDLMVDLVLNHCSRQSLWFADYLADRAPYRDYFLEADPDDDLALVVRPRSTPLLWEVRTHRGIRHLWGTFGADQIDLDYRNPDLLLEMIDILLRYVGSGGRIVRLDAIAFLWKEVGTPCIHLPQTHEVVKLMRDLLEAVAPGTLLLTETNVPYHENCSYFGAQDKVGTERASGDEAHLIYQFTLPPLLLHALHTGTTVHLYSWLETLQREPPPRGCSYINFTASHDGIGLRGLEGWVPPEQVDTLLHEMHARGGFVSRRRLADGREAPYELNISYYEAFRDPRVEQDPWHIPAFVLSQIFTLSLQGIPAIYIHSFTATPNDHYGVELSGRTRAINRRRWDQGELDRLLDARTSEQALVFTRLTHALRVRREHAAFHPDGAQWLLDIGGSALGLIRISPSCDERVVCLYNFVPDTQMLALERITTDGVGEAVGWRDLLSGKPPEIVRGRVLLPPYGCLWLVQDAD